MANASPQFTELVLELLAPLGPISARRFFGGTGLVYEETLFAMLMGDSVFFRVDDRTRPAYEAAGSRPFSYATAKKRVTVASYYALPEELLDDPDALIDWARDAVAAAVAAKGKKAKPMRHGRRPAR